MITVVGTVVVVDDAFMFVVVVAVATAAALVVTIAVMVVFVLFRGLEGIIVSILALHSVSDRSPLLPTFQPPHSFSHITIYVLYPR